MDLQIGEMTSTVRVNDATETLSPSVLEQIVSAVCERLNLEWEHEQRAARERSLTDDRTDLLGSSLGA